MKIQPLAPRALERGVRPVETQSPQPDEVDFSSIDTPDEAAMLPYLEPSFQLALATGLAMATAAAAQNGPLPQVALDTYFEVQGQPIQVSFDLRLGDQLPLATSGQVGGEPVDQRLELAPDWKSASLTGTIGANPVQLDIAQEGDSFAVTGRLGKVDSSLKVTPIFHERGWVQGVICHGTLGGAPYQVQSKFTPEGGLTMEGDLDGRPVQRECHAFGEIVSGTYYLMVGGEGRNGDLPVRATTMLTVTGSDLQERDRA